MKLAFSTLGCPEWDLETIIFKAKEYNFDGVDFRGYLNDLDITLLPEFSSRGKETSKRLQDAGLEVPCFSSSVRMFNADSDAQKKYNLEIIRYVKTCTLFTTPYVRIFGGKLGEVSRKKAVEVSISNLKKMAKIGADYNVKILLETHDDWLDCTFLKILMEQVDSDFVGILWDIHNPFVLADEDPRVTWDTIGRWIQYTHWKDSKVVKDTKLGFEACLMGDGDVPLKKIFNMLEKSNYNGYLTFEWEKRWHPEIYSPETAFPQFSGFMRGLLYKNLSPLNK